VGGGRKKKKKKKKKKIKKKKKKKKTGGGGGRNRVFLMLHTYLKTIFFLKSTGMGLGRKSQSLFWWLFISRCRTRPFHLENNWKKTCRISRAWIYSRRSHIENWLPMLTWRPIIIKLVIRSPVRTLHSLRRGKSWATETEVWVASASNWAFLPCL